MFYSINLHNSKISEVSNIIEDGFLEIKEESSSRKEIYHSSYRSNIDLYYDILRNVDNEKPIEEKIYGGIVPHHFLASELIAKFFKKLEAQKEIETVIIVGPNHFNAGFSGILSSYAFWTTPFGDIEPDIGLIELLEEKKLIEIDEKPFESEHSISTLMPFIKNTFPEAKIVPIIVKDSANQELLKSVALTIKEVKKNNALMVASVDFSHYLPLNESRSQDDMSIKSIESFDLDGIYGLKIDSPPSIYMLLSFLEARNAKNLLFSERSNSALINKRGTDQEDTVGYFVGLFGK